MTLNRLHEIGTLCITETDNMLKFILAIFVEGHLQPVSD